MSNVLDDAKVYSNHAKKKVIDLDDVRLAVQMQQDRSFTNPPSRDVSTVYCFSYNCLIHVFTLLSVARLGAAGVGSKVKKFD